ncbi:hypothetical protein CPAR01_03706 [Colletotrichum paranaense]|uniref:Uncharacterized protein n=2 Tax=Colletotrichum acutatum species complex TaxID=2707335 RepID=A0AAI9Y3C9_9PEZI|nr:uncharacterized protein CPAR01_03706 [Colletotrichum paranaense]KAK1469302.1 hypothetical protein CMEL01_01069 [Colletotrichum melonis]KAK1543073.1 hypothetical protein CPAR01_03706 [Colletotrichum paranaense]
MDVSPPVICPRLAARTVLRKCAAAARSSACKVVYVPEPHMVPYLTSRINSLDSPQSTGHWCSLSLPTLVPFPALLPHRPAVDVSKPPQVSREVHDRSSPQRMAGSCVPN